MPIQEALGSEMNEDQVAAAINSNFELQGGQLTQSQAAQYLAQAIHGLPGDKMRLIAVIGGPASGKGELVQAAMKELTKNGLTADFIGTDDYNLGTRDWRWQHEREDPIMLKDFVLLNHHIDEIRSIGSEEKVAVPTYDPETGLAIAAGRENYTHKIGKTDVLIVEGDFDAAEAPDLKVFVDMPAQTRLQIRVARDLAERGEVDAGKVADSFKSRHKKQYIPHTAPSIQSADIAVRVNPLAEGWIYEVYKRKVL